MRFSPFGRRYAVAAIVGLACLALQLDTLVARERPPRIPYTTTRLPNGLWLVLHEDHSTPIVHVELQYHVGSKNERPGRTGFAHLFEHLMFQGSRNVAQDQHQSLIASVGGESNATTNEDATVYWETIPAQYLPMALWLEADRMATLKVDEAAFQRERQVVKEERRQKVENPPYGRLAEIVYDRAFKVHPYKHQVIGSMADLEAATIDDVRDFYQTYYVPENAVLVIAGDFDSKETMKLVEQYFGRIPKATKPVPRDIPKEPAQTKEVRLTVYEDVPLPAVVVAHHITYDGNPDSYPLHIASKVLSDGQSSRIYQTLVYEKRLALGAFGQGQIIEDPNLFFATAIVKMGQSPDTAAQALIAELDRLRNEPISAHELERTKNQMARDYILQRLTVQDKAGVLAHAAIIHDDLTTADGEYDIFMNTTAADVQRVAKTYFTAENRLVLTILPRAMQGQGPGVTR
jgi:zinc protease